TWATRTILSTCGQLSPEQLDRCFEMGPGSVRKTLLHIASAQMWWTDRLLYRDRKEWPGETHRSATIEQIAKLHESSDAEFREVAHKLIAAGKVADTIKSKPTPDAHKIRIASVLAHVANHGTHH